MDFPVNSTYNRLEEINLGDIEWTGEEQQARMAWIAKNCKGNVLDVGCATGGLLDFLGPTFHQVNYTGIDLDRNRIGKAQAKYKEADFYVMDATFGLPWGVRTFCTAVCADCLEHIPYERAKRLVSLLFDVCANYLIVTLPKSDRMQENVDHVWNANESIVRDLMSVCTNGTITIDPSEHFWLILVRKAG